ncbi:hypothetical protein N8477_06200 [Candidatus Thioglobus sp.]|nr:hypothetical protein [Candidatus Thioglobus sp.]
MKQINCIIRVDASTYIGKGHLVRCLILAKFLAKKKWKISFISLEKQAKKEIERSGFACYLIKSNDKVPNYLISILSKNIVITDVNTSKLFSSQQKYKKYLNNLHEQADLLITFEDMIDIPYSADIVIIPYCGAGEIKLDTKNQNSTYLLGPSYFPLKQELQIKKKDISNKVNNIIITMGGSDPEKITLKVLRALNEIKLDSCITVILGNLCQIKDEEIKNCSKKIIENISIKRNLEDVSGVFIKGDIAFTNSGLTKYELAAVGVPMIILSNNFEQSKFSGLFSLDSLSINLGYHVMVDQSQIVEAFKELASDKVRRKKIVDAGRKLVNGKGIQEIYKEIKISLE